MKLKNPPIIVDNRDWGSGTGEMSNEQLAMSKVKIVISIFLEKSPDFRVCGDTGFFIYHETKEF